MSKVLKAQVKLQLPGGGANASAIGKVMGPHGINLGKFCIDFNAATISKKGDLCSVVVSIFTDKTYTIEYKTPPVSYLLKKKANIEQGASKIGKEFAGTISMNDVMEIAKVKMPDLNTIDLDQACKSILGSAKSMGIKVV